MSDRTPPPKPPEAARETEKSSRLAAALRANLARRKARQRVLTSGEKPRGQPKNEQG